MSWPEGLFGGSKGILEYIRKFSKSPLASRPIPNANASMNSYFQFRRWQGESISSFLVRELLSYEEFHETLLNLKDMRDGVSAEDRTFGLPKDLLTDTLVPPSWSGWGGWRERQWRPWSPGQEQDIPEEDEDSPPLGLHGEEVAPQEEGPAAPAPSPASPHRAQIDERAGSEEMKEDELSEMDSFILDTLRGWHLLAAAALTDEEKRDVLSSTQNKLDYQSITVAVQTLWDDQHEFGRRGHQPQHHGINYAGVAEESSTGSDGGWSDNWPSSPTSSGGGWYEAQAASPWQGNDGDESWYGEETYGNGSWGYNDAYWSEPWPALLLRLFLLRRTWPRLRNSTKRSLLPRLLLWKPCAP
jgi:hypothetical protein